MTDFEIAVITLLIGYFLGQSTDWIKFYFTIWRKRSAINSEINDIIDILGYKKRRIVEIAAMISDPQLIGRPVPSEINELMYSKHFSDVSPYYFRYRRSRISAFYQTVETFNEGVAGLKMRSYEEYNKGLANLFYYVLLSLEAGMDIKNSKDAPDLHDNEDRLSKANKELEDFCLKYELLFDHAR